MRLNASHEDVSNKIVTSQSQATWKQVNVQNKLGTHIWWRLFHSLISTTGVAFLIIILIYYQSNHWRNDVFIIHQTVSLTELNHIYKQTSKQYDWRLVVEVKSPRQCSM